MDLNFAAIVQESLKPMRFYMEESDGIHMFTGFGLFDHVEGIYLHLSVDSYGNTKIWQDITQKISYQQRQDVLERINAINLELSHAVLCINHEDVVELSSRFRLVANETLAQSQVRDTFLEFWELPEHCGAKLTEIIGFDESFYPSKQAVDVMNVEEQQASLLPLQEQDIDMDIFREFDWSTA